MVLCKTSLELAEALLGVDADWLKKGGVLKLNPTSQVFTFHDPEDDCMYHFDIDTAWDLARKEGVLTFLYVEDFGGAENVLSRYRGMSRARAMKTDVNDPVLAMIWGDAYLLVDGNHRMYKAAVLGLEMIPCYRIDDNEVSKRACKAIADPALTKRLLKEGL